MSETYSILVLATHELLTTVLGELSGMQYEVVDVVKRRSCASIVVTLLHYFVCVGMDIYKYMNV